MGFYDRHLLPWLLEHGDAQRVLDVRGGAAIAWRARGARNRVGAGPNLALTAPAANASARFDPSAELLAPRRQAERGAPVPVSLARASPKCCPLRRGLRYGRDNPGRCARSPIRRWR